MDAVGLPFRGAELRASGRRVEGTRGIQFPGGNVDRADGRLVRYLQHRLPLVGCQLNRVRRFLTLVNCLRMNALGVALPLHSALDGTV